MTELRTLVHECFNEMVKINRPDCSITHLIMDVCDRMRLDYDVVEQILEEGIQLELFPEEV